jgi:uncharacterized membrane protein YfcA
VTGVLLSASAALTAVAVVSLASAVQGSLGFGAALLAAPVLLLIHPAFVPGPVIASNLVLTLLVARREWPSVDFAGLEFVVGGRLVGTLVAAGFLATASQSLFDALFGVLVLLAIALSVLRGGFRQSPRNLTVAGLASGLMGTLSSIGGPPVALIYQRASPSRFRATLAVHLIVGAAISLCALWAVGRFGSTELVLTAILLPASIVGYQLSHFGMRHVDVGHVRAAVLVLSSLAALSVLWRALTVVTAAG